MEKFFTLFLLHLALITNCQEVTIYGEQPDYIGEEILFYSNANLITHHEVLIARAKVDSSGYFNTTFSVEKTKTIFAYLGIYKGYLLVEPGKEYQIKLPPHTPKTFEDSINPYFQENELYLGVVYPNTDSQLNDLNYLIQKFDIEYNLYVDKNFNDIRHTGSNEIDTIISKWDFEYDTVKNKYFKSYKYYKIASLKHLAYERNNNYVIRDYYLNKPFLYENEAYMSLFTQLFANFFYKYSKTTDGSQIYNNIGYEKSIYKIKKTLDLNMALANDTLKELVILKACYDECFAQNIPYRAVKQTLDSLIILSKIDKHKEIARDIIEVTMHLRSGYPAPDFELLDLNGLHYDIKSFKGKFIYLNFCTDWSYACKEEFSLLKNIYKNHSDVLEIVSITPKQDYHKLSEYFKQHDYNWPLRYVNDDSVFINYNVRVYPMYYLIDPYGILTLSPAPTPNEKFEWRFFKILRERSKKTD